MLNVAICVSTSAIATLRSVDCSMTNTTLSRTLTVTRAGDRRLSHFEQQATTSAGGGVFKTEQPKDPERRSVQPEGVLAVPHDGNPRPEPIPCPICGQPLKWMRDRWLSAFVCERCGEFSDFDASPSAAMRQPPPPDDAA